MSIRSIVERVAAQNYGLAARRKGNPQASYSVQAEIILSADFEGDVSKPTLIKKLKSEIMASLEASAKITAKELRLDSTGLTIKPLRFSVDVEKSSVEEE